MNNVTIFLYLKVLNEISGTRYKLAHTLFHLHRYLSINSIVKWERLFVFTKKSVEDDGEKKTLRNLMHHDLIDFNTHVLTEKGFDFLKEKEKEYATLTEHVNDFFEQYNGEYAYQNSCFYEAKNLTISCHLCKQHTCIKKDSWLSLLKPSKTFKLKNPSKSFSN